MKAVQYSYKTVRNGYPSSTEVKPSVNALPVWVVVLIPVSKKEATKIIGRKCLTYERGCVACDGWKQWEHDGRVPFTFHRVDLLSL